MNVKEASDRWNDLLERTYLLWEECRRLREECEAAATLRRQQDATAPPSIVNKLVQYASILEAGTRKALDDVGTYHRGGEGGLFGEAWLQERDRRMRRNGETGRE